MRDNLLSDCIPFERKQLLDNVERGWSVPNWVQKTSSDNSEEVFHAFLVGIHTLLINEECPVPQAFLCDYIRIHILRVDFQTLLFHAACLRTFDTTLQKLRWERPVSELSREKLLRRLMALERDVLADHQQQRDAIVLEIVREALALTKTDSLPASELLTCAAQALCKATDRHSDISNSLRSTLAKQLLDLLMVECEVIRDFDAIKMAARADLHARDRQGSWGPVRIESIARGAAHVAMVHWKVWAPVLYLPDPTDNGNGVSSTANIAEN